MLRKTISFLFVPILLFCFACNQTRTSPLPAKPTDAPAAETGAPETPTGTDAPSPSDAPLPYTGATVGDAPSDAEPYAVALSLFDAGTDDFDGECRFTCTFTGLLPRTVDRRANPMRFDGDLSVWTTYDRDGDWDNCVLGRCVSDPSDLAWLNGVLFTRDYEADPDAAVYMQTPRFLVRKGDKCLSSTSIWDVPQKTYYIDDEVCTYWIDPDGTAIRVDADGSLFRAAVPLEKEQVAYLYLLYEAYYMSAAFQCPCPFYPGESDSYRLLVERDGTRAELPQERFDAFTALVTVEADQSFQLGRPCFSCTTEQFANAVYPAPEVLRFRFVQDGYDPDQSPYQWFTLREDGKIVRETPTGAGFIHTVARWRCYGKNRMISDAVFSVDAILAFLEPYGI